MFIPHELQTTPCFSLSMETGGVAGSPCAGLFVPISRISQLPHMLMWVLLLIHTVSLSCGHTVGFLFYRQLVAQPCYSSHYHPCYVFLKDVSLLLRK